MTKSHVGMGCLVCPICLKEHTEQVLLDRRLEDSFENGTMYAIGWELCDEHKATQAEYIGLVEVRGHCTKLEDADRTGQYALIRRSITADVLGQTFPDTLPLVFVEVGVIEKLQGMQGMQE